jgi:hypothetical protein
MRGPDQKVHPRRTSGKGGENVAFSIGDDRNVRRCATHISRLLCPIQPPLAFFGRDRLAPT